MALAIEATNIYDLTSTKDDEGMYYVDFRVKAKITLTSDDDCWLSTATVTICDDIGIVDGPYDMLLDEDLGTDMYSSGLLSLWGVFEEGDGFTAKVEACEECWTDDCAMASDQETVPPASVSKARKKAAGKKKAANKTATKKKKKRSKKA